MFSDLLFHYVFDGRTRVDFFFLEKFLFFFVFFYSKFCFWPPRRIKNGREFTRTDASAARIMRDAVLVYVCARARVLNPFIRNDVYRFFTIYCSGKKTSAAMYNTKCIKREREYFGVCVFFFFCNNIYARMWREVNGFYM